MSDQAIWLYKEIVARGGQTGLTSQPSMTTIQTSLKSLAGFVDKKRHIFEPAVTAIKDYKNLLMLTYYKNHLIHLFLNEALIAISILGFQQF
jgi:glycerol-3-phosphate O-acyltransferase